MRIVSWNIRAGGGRRVDAIAAQIERWRPDVLVLIEFRATPPSARLCALVAELGLCHQASTADPAQPAANRLLVASRQPLRPVRSRHAPSEPGRWLLVRLDAPPPLVLGAMHVPNRVSGRKDAYHRGVLEFVRRWRGGPALLAGDTNSGWIGLDEEVPCFGKREDAWMSGLEQAGWRDAFRLRNPDARAYTWHSPNAGNGFRLDEAFVNKGALPLLVDTRYEWGSAGGARRDELSDHAALIIDLAL